MKSFIHALACALTLLSTALLAQNKTFSVGTPAPNANAALHVESPTNNQGIIIPRLTTAQRTSFTGALGAGDVGLIVFDTNLRVLAIWNGTAWDLGLKTGEPIIATNAGATGHAGLFENTNASNTNPTLLLNKVGPGNAITANAPVQATAFVGDGSRLSNIAADSIDGLGPLALLNNIGSVNISDNSITNDDVFSGAAIAGTKISPNFGGQRVVTTDTVSAAVFIGDGSALTGVSGFTLPRKDSISTDIGLAPDVFALSYNFPANKRILSVDNLSRDNSSSAVSISNNGSGVGLYVQNTNDTTSVSTVFASTNSDNGDAIPGPASIYGESTGLAGAAGSFKIVNPLNNRSAVYAETMGTGDNIYSMHNGVDGHAGYFWVADTTNFGNAVRAQTDGIGSAARLEVLNPNNTSAALQINHYGSGQAINAVKTTDGGVANFQIVDPNNNFNALDVTTSGNGYALNAITSGGQRAAYFMATNPSSSAPAVTITSLAAVYALEVSGYGQGSAGYFSADSSANVIQVRTDGANTQGGSFLINNPSNAQAAIHSQTSGTGPALELRQLNNGAALVIAQGGLRYSVETLAAGGSIANRAAIYHCIAPGTYSIGWSADEGDTFHVRNGTVGSITFQSVSIPQNTGRQFVYLGLAWVPL